MQYCEPLEDGIFEIRTIMGSNIARVLYFFVIGRKIIMTNGFIKKTRKTPRQEFETAKNTAIFILTG
ncbi:MAG: type II toxin-antitoxin system RelE/ParE family toxin [Clostridia bacterium]|nr:type II toxin-antitoxin system RelE/ParE family toxin [Clostridia bacterium]